MIAIWKSIPLAVRITGIAILALALIAAIQFGYILGEKSRK
jgi:hypothetical protein